MNKKGQVSIYVIIAVLLVAIVIFIYLFRGKIETYVSGDIDPNEYLNLKLKESIIEGKELLARQGSYSKPEGFIQYDGEQVKYLCYTSEYYIPCKVQQPLLRNNFEKELVKLIENDVKESVLDLISQYERRGYSIIENSQPTISVEIKPEAIVTNIGMKLSVEKNEDIKNFDSFNIEIPSKIYFLLMTSTSIIDYESSYGDSETSLFIQYYPNLVMEKTKLMDGSKIYKVGDITTGESFVFASRSVAWPGGLGLTSEG